MNEEKDKKAREEKTERKRANREKKKKAREAKAKRKRANEEKEKKAREEKAKRKRVDDEKEKEAKKLHAAVTQIRKSAGADTQTTVMVSIDPISSNAGPW